MKNVRILGSCVTRDAFEITTDFKLVDYTARTSLASLATKSRIDSGILNNIKSTFQKRMVERDMTKRFWLSLENSHGHAQAYKRKKREFFKYFRGHLHKQPSTEDPPSPLKGCRRKST